MELLQSVSRRLILVEIRVMPSTLNPKLIPMGSIINNISEDSETIMVWSLDKNSWRDIRVNTILEWNVEG